MRPRFSSSARSWPKGDEAFEDFFANLCLRLTNRTAPFVEVDPPGGVGAIAVVEADGAFEDVGVLGTVGPGRLGAGDVEHVAQLGQEVLVVGPLGAAGGGSLAKEKRVSSPSVGMRGLGG